MSNWTISIPKVAFNHHGSKEVIYLTDNFNLQKPHVYSINRLISANHSRSIKLEIGTEERSMSYKDLENAKQPRVLYCMTETPRYLSHLVDFGSGFPTRMYPRQVCAVLCCYCVVLCCAVLLLCCAVLCCAVLCCAVLCCAVLCCAVLCCAVLCCAVLCCAVLCCVVLCCAVLCCAALCCIVLYRLYGKLMYCTLQLHFAFAIDN